MNNDLHLSIIRELNDAHVDLIKAIDALLANGFRKTPTGEWMPALGKRPDLEGFDLIAAAAASVDAQQLNIDCRRQLIDAVQKYKEAKQ
jgi:hypothetical protein